MSWTDDPASDWDRYCAEEDEWEDKLPVCDECKDPIHDDYYFDIEGYLYCEECLAKSYRKSTEDYCE